MSTRPIRVLVVEDTPVVRDFLLHIFKSDPAFEVVGSAANGAEAVSAVPRLQPDVVTMDVHMPVMSGLEATRQLMHSSPLPIVIVSGIAGDQVAATFDALDAGAVAFLVRPSGFGNAQHEHDVAELLRTVKLMSEVKVVRRRSKAYAPVAAREQAERRLRVVAIGASTGGPLAILTLLQGLPRDFPVPILIVQHIAEGFLGGFVDWLNRTSAIPVQVAVDGAATLQGHAYIAPDGLHMGIDQNGAIRLSDAAMDNGLRPSVAHLLRSVRDAYREHVAAVLLSGMGKDGAAELLELRRCGAYTFVQDRATSVVYGMPGSALALDAARYVMAPEEIAVELCGIACGGIAHA